jgi:hypothetical protein
MKTGGVIAHDGANAFSRGPNPNISTTSDFPVMDHDPKP